MSFVEGLTFAHILDGGLALLGVYLAARLITAAYFNSKHHYEQRKDHAER